MTSTDKKVGYLLSGKRPDYTPQTAAHGVEAALQMLEGRWKMIILFHLFGQQLMRFSDLERAIPAISQKMLIQQLRKLEADGIVALESAVAAATEAHDKADAAVEALEAKLAGLDQRQNELLDVSKDASLNTAVEGLVAAIAREDLASLYKEAMATETPEDEKIVRMLRDIEPKLARREAEAEEVRKAAVELAHKRAELEQSRDNFHRSGYNDPRGQFADGALIDYAAWSCHSPIDGSLNAEIRICFSHGQPMTCR